MSDRMYTSCRAYAHPTCEHDCCHARATFVAEYTEDVGYVYMAEWIADEINDVAYFCGEHLPVPARSVRCSALNKVPQL